MDHLVLDPRGYWVHDADLVARLAVKGERARWCAMLTRHLPADTIRHLTDEIIEAAEEEKVPGTHESHPADPHTGGSL